MDGDNKIKSHWRHVRSRFYFTSASHMYTLLNVIKYGMKQAVKLDNVCNVSDNRLDEIIRLDFLSGIYFRVFENLHSEEHDPARFKLDIQVSPGAVMDQESIKMVENHTVPITLENLFSKTLMLEDIDFFFDIILEMSEGKEAGFESKQ